MTTNIIRSLRQGCAALLIVAMLFVLFEPTISQGAVVDDTFIITQAVTSEISFLATANDVVMSPSLGGISGGTATGATNVRVFTNNDTGYNMTITASSSLGMIGNASSTNSIPAYAYPGTSTPQFAFTVPANKAYFGYTVEASTTADLAQAFKDNGSTCNTGTGDTVDRCWLNASTSAVTIINRSLPTPTSGATTTIKFQVVINSNPSPAIPNDTYTATTTLTATTN